MARYKNIEWILPDQGSNARDGVVHSAVLMDIRAELQKLNRVFECANFVDIPRKLDRIVDNTRKPRKRRRAK